MGALLNVTADTDGACSGNPGPGGYGCILQYVDAHGVLHERTYSEGFMETTLLHRRLSRKLYLHLVELLQDL